MKQRGFLAGIALWALALWAPAQEMYFPPKGGGWERIDPAGAGFDPGKLAEAVEYAKTHESSHPRDFSNQVSTFGRVLGPMPGLRGATKGLILYRGRILAEWGDIDAVEPTYSAAKSFLSTLAGIAWDQKRIEDLNEPVGSRVKDGGYDSAHNAKVTWAHHLWQSSEWEGTMWGKSSTFLGEEEFGQGRRPAREIREPGTYYEYNDVRVNRLALSLLRVFGRSLPEVMKTDLMDPIGASSSWVYHNYENAWVEVEGKKLPSVSGGTRWGGGLWISARDQARFGLLFLNHGKWGERQVVSAEWVKRAIAPSPRKDDYGMLWWLNTGRKAWPALSERAFAAVGFGSNTVWVDPENDLVVVWRWHAGNGAELLQRLMQAKAKPDVWTDGTESALNSCLIGLSGGRGIGGGGATRWRGAAGKGDRALR